jgi:hypothetical protein
VHSRGEKRPRKSRKPTKVICILAWLGIDRLDLTQTARYDTCFWDRQSQAFRKTGRWKVSVPGTAICQALEPRLTELGIGQIIFEHTWVHISTGAPVNPVNAVLTLAGAGYVGGIEG